MRRTVSIHSAPFVTGQRAAHYFGPVMAERFVPDPSDHDKQWISAEMDLLEALRHKAWIMGANSVIGTMIDLDPFANRKGRTGLYLKAEGTAAILEAIQWP